MIAALTDDPTTEHIAQQLRDCGRIERTDAGTTTIYCAVPACPDFRREEKSKRGLAAFARFDTFASNDIFFATVLGPVVPSLDQRPPADLHLARSVDAELPAFRERVMKALRKSRFHALAALGQIEPKLFDLDRTTRGNTARYVEDWRERYDHIFFEPTSKTYVLHAHFLLAGRQDGVPVTGPQLRRSLLEWFPLSHQVVVETNPAQPKDVKIVEMTGYTAKAFYDGEPEPVREVARFYDRVGLGQIRIDHHRGLGRLRKCPTPDLSTTWKKLQVVKSRVRDGRSAFDDGSCSTVSATCPCQPHHWPSDDDRHVQDLVDAYRGLRHPLEHLEILHPSTS